MNEGSINRENFSFDLPFDITLDPRYDVDTVVSDIEDFYYDVENEDTLRVNIDLYVEAEYLPEKEKEEVRKAPAELTLPEEPLQDLEITEYPFKEEKVEPTPVIIEKSLNHDVDPRDNMKDMPALAADLFSNLDDTETYTTYYVYIVKEDDTIDKIMTKYGVTKEDLEAYNNLAEIKPGDKVIVPKTSGE
jgi:LysM repeat protein